jgi:hypothetical protein
VIAIKPNADKKLHEEQVIIFVTKKHLKLYKFRRRMSIFQSYKITKPVRHTVITSCGKLIVTSEK